MKDKEFAAEKKRVQKYIKKWDLPLGIRWWEQIHDWCDEPIGEGEGGLEAGAQVTVEWKYCRVIFQWYLPGLAVMSEESLERTVVHEMAHVLIEEAVQARTKDDAQDHKERCTELLARAFLYLARNPFPVEKKNG